MQCVQIKLESKVFLLAHFERGGTCIPIGLLALRLELSLLNMSLSLRLLELWCLDRFVLFLGTLN